MFERVESTQSCDITVARGSCSCNTIYCLGDYCRCQECSESDFLAVYCAGCVGGISADMIQRPWCQAGDVARESANCADRTVRGFTIRDGGIGIYTPDDTMLGWIGDT